MATIYRYHEWQTSKLLKINKEYNDSTHYEDKYWAQNKIVTMSK